MGRSRELREVALYRGETFLDIGTIPALAKKWGLKRETLYFCASKTGHARRAGKKLRDNTLIVIGLDEEDE